MKLADTPLLSLLLLFLIMVLLSFASVEVIRRLAIRRHILDYPEERRLHTFPTPRGGGLAIVMLTLSALLYLGWSQGFDRHLLTILLGGSGVAWLGWRDDVHSLPAGVRFLGQSLIAGITLLGLGTFHAVTIPLLGVWTLGACGPVLTFLWIVGLINAYNFMDGIDGMAAGVAVVAGLGWALLASADPLPLWLGWVIAASSLGFLLHNRPPARIFMGDVGSTFLGYNFAILPLLAPGDGSDAPLSGVLLMWTFFLDTGLTFLHRLRRGENVFTPHRSHLYQRLVASGLRPGRVSALFALLTVLGAGLAWGWTHHGEVLAPFITLGLPLLWALLSIFADRRPLTQDN